MKQTPGPWKLGKVSDTVITNTETPSDKSHFEHYGGQVVAESISSDKDRHLISAAPDLLEALIETLILQDKVHAPDVWNKARKAIRKAMGELS